MKKYVDFNVNFYVWVKLTDSGRKELEKQHNDLYGRFGLKRKYTPISEDEDGWSRWQMHSLMNYFGHLMVLGFNMPFEPNIRVEV